VRPSIGHLVKVLNCRIQVARTLEEHVEKKCHLIENFGGGFKVREEVGCKQHVILHYDEPLVASAIKELLHDELVMVGDSVIGYPLLPVDKSNASHTVSEADCGHMCTAATEHRPASHRAPTVVQLPCTTLLSMTWTSSCQAACDNVQVLFNSLLSNPFWALTGMQVCKQAIMVCCCHVSDRQTPETLENGNPDM
jgi:hypothetical protein